MSSIADIYASVRLKLKWQEFEADATKAGEKAGQSAGDAMSSGIAQKLKATMLGAGGAALGAGLGLALSGAQELDTVMRQLRATTGMTADEAERAQASMVGLFKDNLQSFTEIGEAMGKVHNDLGLTGDAAERATGLFLKFATATGIDAARAVESVDNVLDSWNLTAADAEDLMNKLIVSSQEYGGTVDERLASLSRLAPAMQAANMDLDDGIGLLNMFAEVGMNTSDMTEAMAAAVAHLKPGQNLTDLFNQLLAIEDPTLRAQAAIEILGQTAGVNFANALRPGIGSLDDFAVSSKDAAGTVTDMAEIIEDSLVNRVKMAFKEVSGTLTEFGTSLGDLALIVALLGPKLTTAMMAAIGGVASYIGLEAALAGIWTKVAASPVVLAAASAAGSAGAIAFAGGVVGVGVFQWLGDRIRDAWEGVTGVDLGLESTLEAQIQKGADKYKASNAPEKAARTYADGLRTAMAAEPVDPAAIVPKMGEVGFWGTSAGELLMYNYTKAIESGRAAALAAWRSIMDDRNEVANAADQIIINNAAITAAKKVLADKKSTAVEKAEARIRIRNLRAANIDLQLEAVNSGTRMEKIVKLQSMRTSEAMKNGLKSKDPQIRQYWTDLKSGIEEKLGDLGVYGNELGRDFAHGFVQGLKSHNVAVRNQAANIIRMLNLSNRYDGMASGGLVTAGTPYIVGERRPELFVPATDGRILPSVPSGFGSSDGGGMTLTVNVTAGGDTSLGQAKRFGQAVLDVVADGLREQTARYAR